MVSEVHSKRGENIGETETQVARITTSDPPRSDVVFELLRNSRRRMVLRYVENEKETTIGDLAERIAAKENDIPRQAVRSNQRKRVYISLYQSHLPKMDDAGAIAYNQDRGTVQATDRLTEFVSVLDQFEKTSSEPVSNRVLYKSGGIGLLVMTVGVELGMSLQGVTESFRVATCAVLITLGVGLIVMGYRLR